MDEVTTASNELIAAIERGDVGAVRRCLHDGCDVNAVDNRPVIGYGAPPLHHAVEAGSAELVRLLIGAGAVVDAPDPTGATPLWRACSAGYLAVAQVLLAAGADPNAQNGEGYSCLGRVCRPWVELADLLRSNGAAV